MTDMRHGRTITFVMLALLAGGIVVQLPLAAADDSDSPFSALWNAIFDLKSRDDQLQAQIDELRSERQSLPVQISGAEATRLVSDLYANIEVQALEQGRTIVHITAGNNGPDRAAGVRLTAFYLMPLFEINSINGDLCMDKSRGIIECIIGTIEQGQQVVISIDTTAREFGRSNTWTVDVSTTTDDANYSNNHVTYNFETGSGKQIIEVIEIQQPEERKVVEEEPVASIEPEQVNDNGGTVPDNNTGVEEPENVENQTSSDPVEETQGESQTSTEPQDAGSDNDGDNNSSPTTDVDYQEDRGSEEMDSSNSNNNTDAYEDDTAQSEEEGTDASNSEAQQDQQGEPESSQPAAEQQQTREQDASEQSSSEPEAGEPSGQSPASESSVSSGQESD
ncbi:MAG: hypothetical protein HRF40_13815, partial [Nitrososphaera sp.]